MKLCEQNDLIMDALQRRYNYSPKISLNELFELIPRDRKKSERYSKLRSALRKLGIKMEIQ